MAAASKRRFRSQENPNSPCSHSIKMCLARSFLETRTRDSGLDWKRTRAALAIPASAQQAFHHGEQQLSTIREQFRLWQTEFTSPTRRRLPLEVTRIPNAKRFSS